MGATGAGTVVYGGARALDCVGKSRCVMVAVGVYAVGTVGTAVLKIPGYALSSESGLCGLDGGIALVDAYSGGESNASSLSEASPKSLSLNGVLSGDGIGDVLTGAARAL